MLNAKKTITRVYEAVKETYHYCLHIALIQRPRATYNIQRKFNSSRAAICNEYSSATAHLNVIFDVLTLTVTRDTIKIWYWQICSSVECDGI